MSTAGTSDPAMYEKLREYAMGLRVRGVPDYAVHIIMMDWHVPNGTMTVLAAADGTASLYLSSGGGFLGGGQKYTEIRDAALHAVMIAAESQDYFKKAKALALPGAGNISFWIRTGPDLVSASVSDADLKAGKSPLGPLGTAMQEIVTRYRQRFSTPSAEQ